MVGLLCAVKAPVWMVYEPLSSYQLLLIGGVLLILVGLLIGFRRRARVAVAGSAVSEELLTCLARIANALEKQQANRISPDEITAEVLRRLEQREEPKANGGSREIVGSMFGREYTPKD